MRYSIKIAIAKYIRSGYAGSRKCEGRIRLAKESVNIRNINVIILGRQNFFPHRVVVLLEQIAADRDL